MAVGLYLCGTIGVATDDAAATVERFVRHRWAGELLALSRSTTDHGGSVIDAQTHPAADSISLSVQGDRITVSARTSAAGPGYHVDVCDALRDLGRSLDVAWDDPDEDAGTGDETGYFVTRDVAAVEQAMLDWLQLVVAKVIERRDEGVTALAIAMPDSPQYIGPPNTAVLTQLGPRDDAWLARVRNDPSTGVDLFPWWRMGRGADYELGRALVHLWLDVKFGGEGTDSEVALAKDVIARLEQACRLDPSLPYPWAAWAYLHDVVLEAPRDALPDAVRSRATGAALASIGYRHHDIVAGLAGGWRITLPGAFSEHIDEKGTWSASHARRTIWASSFSIVNGDTPVPAAEVLSNRAAGRMTTIEGLAYVHKASVETFDEDGQTLHSLVTEIAVDGRLLLVTIVVPNEATIAWARRVVATVRA